MEDLYKLTEEVKTLVEQHKRFRATIKKVISHHESDEEYDEIQLDFEVIGLPQYRIYAVRNIEPITAQIGDYDFMPIVQVREDFPLVPHLNVFEDNTKTLCYSDLPYEEIKHKMSGRFLLTCIENWFLKTSLNKLHRSDQPLEPFFPFVNNVIIWERASGDYGIKRYITEDREFGKLMYQCDSGDNYAELTVYVSKDHLNVIRNMPHTLLDLLRSFENETTIEKWLGLIASITSNPKMYNRYFNQVKNKLLACKAIFNIIIPKSRTADDLPESYDVRTFVTESSLKEILADYGLAIIGSKTVKSNKKDAIGYGANISVEPFNVHIQNSKNRNGFLNSITEEYIDKRIVLVGVGAIGSHMLSTFLHEGYGKWTIIDNDYLWPHNIVRHVLTGTDIGYRKVNALKKLSFSIQSDSDIEAIPENIFTESDLVCKALEDSDIIIDASASVAVEKHLALDTNSVARQVSCFLNPKGSATIMLLESADRKIRLDLLEMQYYRELVQNEKIVDHMKMPGTIVYVNSCRDITSRISQGDVSLSAALCCKALKKHLKDDDGKIVIWTHEEDSVTRDIFFADGWIEYKYNEWIVEISESLFTEMHEDRKEHMPDETGGVLIGAFDMFRRRVYIVHQVKAPEDSISSPTSFIRGCKNLPQKLERIHNVTFGNLTFIGEWHSHPNDNTEKSHDDERLHDTIIDYNRENCYPGIMMIVGDNKHTIYLGE